MCGIIGISSKNNQSLNEIDSIQNGVHSLFHRGPDFQSFKKYSNLALGHTRLSIIDLSDKSNQPMVDENENYTLIFNGEIYNYKNLKKELIQLGFQFFTDSDTEVLLKLLIHFGEKGIEKLNGFFSFCFYDSKNEKLILARDRFGIKPLYFYEDENKFIFSSEIRSFFQFNIDKKINLKALNSLFQYTYIPSPLSILEKVSKAEPGNYYIYKNNELKAFSYYKPQIGDNFSGTYSEAIEKVNTHVFESVEKRMVADVEVGTFLSGGVDSSIISLVSKEFKKDIKTFSIGFDHEFFDESKYARILAKKINSQHFEKILSQNEFKDNFEDFLSNIDEPFADSSAFAVFLLSKFTKKHVSVCLSGDGADEVFGGYRKHQAEWIIRNSSKLKEKSVKSLAKSLSFLNENRSGKTGNFNRKLQKISNSYSLTSIGRYNQLCSFIDVKERGKLLLNQVFSNQINEQISNENLSTITNFLILDQKFILPNDMLTKVDVMSMSQALEIRTPFLDYHLVDFVNTLPDSFKVDKNHRKKILVDTFKDRLPKEIYDRQKKGFEIPIYDWLNNDIDSILNSKIFSKEYIENQQIFNYSYIENIKKIWKNRKFGDKIYLVWTLIVFQNWWNKYIL